MKILKESGGFWVLLVFFMAAAFLAVYVPFVNGFDFTIRALSVYGAAASFFGWRLYAHRAIFFDDKNMYLKSYFKKEMEVVPLNDVISFKSMYRYVRPGFNYLLQYRLNGRSRFRLFQPVQKNISKFKILIGDIDLEA